MANLAEEPVTFDVHTPLEAHHGPAVATPPFGEQPPKLKGRQRFLASLPRISSNGSLRTTGRPRARTYNGSGRGSISCISLNSGSLHGSPLSTSLTQELAIGASTTPASAATTPGVHVPDFDERARIRLLTSLEGRATAILPSDKRTGTLKSMPTCGIAELDEDYFSRAVTKPRYSKPRNFNLWTNFPNELKIKVLTYLGPKEIVRVSSVSKSWHQMCFDGQLWSSLDTAGFYSEIPADALIKIITYAGPFVRDLNLRGCIQLTNKWHINMLPDACQNLEYFSLEGCRIDRVPMHGFLHQNGRLIHLNLSGLSGVHISTMKIIAANCPKLEHLNVSWCLNLETRGLKYVVEACENLKDLRAGELGGWDNLELMHEIFKRNTLERLVLMHCDSLTDEALAVLMEGRNEPVDPLTDRPIVPPRKLRHLDLTRCRGITDQGLRTLVGNIPAIEGLSLSKCRDIVDLTLTPLFDTTPLLSHLDMEELTGLTNATLLALANSPCAKRLRHLSISYCETLGDSGMLPLLKRCPNLRSLEMDNTRISDLVLAEAASMMKLRPRTLKQDRDSFKPAVGLRLVAYDCQHVTWTGVREILSRNAEVFVNTYTKNLPPLEKTMAASSSSATSSSENLPAQSRITIARTCSYPSEIIQLKCFYTYQPTVEEHTKRVLRGDFTAARRLERKWAEFMVAQEEAGTAGAGHRRRRRRAREAQMMHADEEDGPGTGSGVGGGRRRRARSGGCTVM